MLTSKGSQYLILRHISDIVIIKNVFISLTYSPLTILRNKEVNYWVIWVLSLWVKDWEHLGSPNSIITDTTGLQIEPYFVDWITEKKTSYEKDTSHSSHCSSCMLALYVEYSLDLWILYVQ